MELYPSAVAVGVQWALQQVTLRVDSQPAPPQDGREQQAGSAAPEGTSRGGQEAAHPFLVLWVAAGGMVPTQVSPPEGLFSTGRSPSQVPLLLAQSAPEPSLGIQQMGELEGTEGPPPHQGLGGAEPSPQPGRRKIWGVA